MFRRLWHRTSKPKEYLSFVCYWRDRAQRYGRRSVLNLAHNEREYDTVTVYQKQILFPLLSSQLNGSESIALDFGCGPGRFTRELAQLINGTVVGVDIAPELLKMAPTTLNVTFACIGTDIIPFHDASFDIVWSSLVLGGIPDERIEQSIAEIERILRPGGLFFFVENTAKLVNTTYWFFRDEGTYVRLAAFCNPEVLGRYEDIGQPISIFAGKKSQGIQ
jgi:SAM-dependent methyltransferase